MLRRTLLRRTVLRRTQGVSLEAKVLGEVEEGRREEELPPLLLLMEMEADKGMEKVVVSLHRRRRREADCVKINGCSVSFRISFLLVDYMVDGYPAGF